MNCPFYLDLANRIEAIKLEEKRLISLKTHFEVGVDEETLSGRRRDFGLGVGAQEGAGVVEEDVAHDTSLDDYVIDLEPSKFFKKMGSHHHL